MPGRDTLDHLHTPSHRNRGLVGRLADGHARVPGLLLAADGLAWAGATVAVGAAWGWSLAFAVILVGVYAALGLYRTRLTLSVLDDLPRLAGGALLATAVATSLQALTAAGASLATYEVGAAVFAGVLSARIGAYWFIRRVRAHDLVSHRTLVLGAGSVGRDVAEKIETHPEFGLRLLGFVDTEQAQGEGPLGLPVVGDHRDLVRVVREDGVSVVIVAFGGVWANELVDVLRSCRGLGCDIFVVPRLYEVQAPGRPDYLRSIPLLRLNSAPELTLRWRFKRLFDVAVSSLALVLFAPLLLATALAVRLETGPGVLFRQERVGRYRHRFTLLKFRSYRPSDRGESETRWSLGQGDIGPVGRLIRRTSIDELPQLFNVLRGDMSLVGPRPERPHFVDQFEADLPVYRSRHRLPAGLTGWAAVNGLRGDTSIEERAKFDNAYIDNWSLWLDAKILIRTMAQVLRGGGA